MKKVKKYIKGYPESNNPNDKEWQQWEWNKDGNVAYYELVDADTVKGQTFAKIIDQEEYKGYILITQAKNRIEITNKDNVMITVVTSMSIAKWVINQAVIEMMQEA